MTDTTAAPRAATPLPVAAVRIDDDFWAPRIDIVRTSTIPFQYHQLQTVGHLEALAGRVPASGAAPHIFWDSDVAKWIEAASYSLVTHPDPELETRLDEVIALLASAQGEDGYLNSYFSLVAPEKRWTDLRDAHELYCAGHLIEAAVAHHAATGSTALLDVMTRYADCIGTVFGRGAGQLPGYDGHEEIELALVKLADATGERRYLDLASYFVEERGREPYFFDEEERRRGDTGWFGDHFPGAGHPGRRREYLQSHAPVREQTEVVGHAVRGMYLYSAMADLAREQDDASLLDACRRLWDHLTSTRMYVTGGIGTSAVNEGYTEDFDLPSETAYAETCAAIGLAMWAQRLLRIDRDRRYADVMELAIHNAVLVGSSHEGTCFFYDNPLASRGGVDRHEWFEVACCPPNLARLLTSLGTYAYQASGDELVVHLYIGGTARLPVAGGDLAIRVETGYPWSGTVRIRIEEAPDAGEQTLALRIPAWSTRTTARVGDETLDLAGPDSPVGADGYLSLRRGWRVGDEVVVELDLAPRRLRADPRLAAEAGNVAIARGPFVYAAEEVDNGPELQTVSLPSDAVLVDDRIPTVPDVVALTGAARRTALPGTGLYRTAEPIVDAARLTLLPYFAWANRGAGEMRVWLREDRC